jgi:hypothetical protein
MPTISQLPSVETVTAADEVPVSQNGVTRSVSVGALLASMQPAVICDSGTLLGRISLGAGGPRASRSDQAYCSMMAPWQHLPSI